MAEIVAGSMNMSSPLITSSVMEEAEAYSPLGGAVALGEVRVLSVPADSTMFEKARPFTMPVDSRISVDSRRLLMAVLLSIMLTMGCLLVWFALVPRGDAQAAAVNQEQVLTGEDETSEAA